MGTGTEPQNTQIEVSMVEEPSTGLTHYFLTDHEELDPNGEPVMVELTATEYATILQDLEK